MPKVVVFPWSDVAWDIARSEGMTQSKFDEMGLEDAQLVAKTDLGTRIWKAMLSGEITARDEKGSPRSAPPHQYHYKGVSRPYLHPKDVNKWLANNGYLCEWTPGTTYDTPLSRAVVQENEIIQTIRSLRYNPLALPLKLRGQRGVKAAVKTLIGSQGMWAGTTVFDKAWDRLRRDGRIADEK